MAAKANEGVVTLTGTVGDGDLKALAEDTVSNLPGVTRVVDQIALDPALAEHSDRWIAIWAPHPVARAVLGQRSRYHGPG